MLATKPHDVELSSQKARNTAALTFQHMPSQPSLLDLFLNRKGRLPVFRRQAEANVLEHLAGNSIICESKQSNDFVAFTERYTDVDLLDDDIPASRNGIISTLRKQAMIILKEKSIEALAKPCVKIEVHLDASKAGFTLTATLYFFNPNKQVL